MRTTQQFETGPEKFGPEIAGTDYGEQLRKALDLIRTESQAQDRQGALPSQWRRNLYAFTVTWMSPAALAALAAQVTLFPKPGLAAQMLIGAEVVLLFFAFLTTVLPFGKWRHLGWLNHRTRAQLLWREEILLEAGVGPYLAEPDPLPIAQARVKEILEAAHPATHLTPSSGGTYWVDALDDHRSAPLPILGPEFVKQYLEARLVRQLDWMHHKEKYHHKIDHQLEGAVQGVVAGAVILALWHLGVVWPGSVMHFPSPYHELLAMAALVLPGVGASLVALRGLMEPHRIARSYAVTVGDLEQMRAQFEELLAQASGDDLAFAYRARRLVLRAEAVLAEEHRRWRVIMEPEEPKGGA